MGSGSRVTQGEVRNGDKGRGTNLIIVYLAAVSSSVCPKASSATVRLSSTRGILFLMTHDARFHGGVHKGDGPFEIR